jgi:hypothetical protein
MEELLLSSCSLHGEIPALILLTVWRNACSLPANCIEKYLLSPCSLHGEIPALILLPMWRNLCSLPAHAWINTCAQPSLLTVWRNYCSLPAHCMEKYLL